MILCHGHTPHDKCTCTYKYPSDIIPLPSAQCEQRRWQQQYLERRSGQLFQWGGWQGREEWGGQGEGEAAELLDPLSHSPGQGYGAEETSEWVYLHVPAGVVNAITEAVIWALWEWILSQQEQEYSVIALWDNELVELHVYVEYACVHLHVRTCTVLSQ